MNKGTINLPVLALAFPSMGSTDAPKLNKISGFSPYFQTASLKRQLTVRSHFLALASARDTGKEKERFGTEGYNTR